MEDGWKGIRLRDFSNYQNQISSNQRSARCLVSCIQGGLGVANNGAKLKLLSWSHPCTGSFSLKKCIYMHLSAFWRFPCKGPSITVGTSKHFAGFSNFQPSAVSHHRGRLSSGPHSGKHRHSWLENGPESSRCILFVFPIEDGHISLLCWFTRGKQKPVPVQTF